MLHIKNIGKQIVLLDLDYSSMHFGKVAQPSLVDFELPVDHSQVNSILGGTPSTSIAVSVGCAKWNREDLKGFYPRGTKDELKYYATQFNAIALNVTFYTLYSPDQYQKWYDKTPV